MKILVTGAVGFIGSHLCEKLNSLGFIVSGIDNFSEYYSVELKNKNKLNLTKLGIDVITLDLANLDDLLKLNNDFDYIFHLAAQPGISNTVSFEDYLHNNFVATKNLLQFALKNKNLKQFINISTSSVYGLYATSDEDSAPKPASYYGVTKLAAEQLVLSYVRNNLINACSLRLYSVYGPRERPDKMFSKLIDCAYQNIPFTLNEGSDKHLRSFTYVKDIVEGMVTLLKKEDITNGEIYNIGSDKEYTTGECIKLVEKLSNHKIEIVNSPKRVGDQFRTIAIIEKARNVLNYNPKYNLEQGVLEQIESYLNQ